MKILCFLVLIAVSITPKGSAIVDNEPAYILPVQSTLSSGYGMRWGKPHKGIDIAAPIGMPVSASAEGTVSFAGWNKGGNGNLVEISHPDGSTTRYAHNNRLLVKRNDFVRQGELIAEVGSTGRSTGPHCHFEIRLPKVGAVDPLSLISPADKYALTSSSANAGRFW